MLKYVMFNKNIVIIFLQSKLLAAKTRDRVEPFRYLTLTRIKYLPPHLIMQSISANRVSFLNSKSTSSD